MLEKLEPKHAALKEQFESIDELQPGTWNA
jgi:hypothetical protein